jgi:CRP-like cAMP-binding protein
MKFISVTHGVSVLQDNDKTLLFGCPPEVIKHLSKQGIPSPDVIVLPDTAYRFDVLQNCTEFPLYSFLFVEGNFFKGKKLTIVGTRTHVRANRKLLRLTLLGPTEAEYKKIGNSDWYEDLYKESRAMSLKDKTGKEYTIDDFIDFVPFSDGRAKLPNSLEILHTGVDQYSVQGETINISFSEPQDPPYDLRNDFVSPTPIHFGATVLGGASGFIEDKPCSSILLHYNTELMLVDCPPYLQQALNARGVANTEIRSLYLTHIHDDHCNIFPLLRLSNKIKLITTKEIFWMAMMKLSLQTLIPMEDLSQMVDFVEVHPYTNTEFYGLSIEPHYTVHSIPTIGATFRMSNLGVSHSIVFIGDNKSFTDIEEMVLNGTVRKEKFEIIKARYTDKYDLLFADGGMGILHGDPKDAVDSKSDRIVFMHLEKLPAEFDATFSQAVAGKRYAIIQGTHETYMIRTMQILMNAFPTISHHWGSALMNNFHIVNSNAGDVIFKQNEISNGKIYIILAGSCSVMYHDGKTLTEKARKEAGDFVGEMAVLDENKVRSASIVASTPVVLGVLDEQLFHEFILSENRTDEMRHLWKVRSEIEKFAPFSQFQDNINDRIARAADRISVTQGESVIAQGNKDQDFYVILSGEFSVRHNDIKVKNLSKGDMFGEYASIDDSVRNATVTATADSVVLKISREEMHKIVESAPIFHFSMREIMNQRSKELKKLEKAQKR